MFLYRRVVAVALLLAACGGDSTTGPSSDTTTPTPTPVATSITLSATSVSLASLGATSQLSATVKDQTGATIIWPSVEWVSSDRTVATVYSQGQGAHAAIVTAVGNGTATITVWREVTSMDTVSATASVTVAQAAATLSFSDSTLTFASLSY